MNTRVSPAADGDEIVRELMRDIELGAAGAPLRARKLDRRTFMKLTGMAGGGLLLGFQVGDAQAASAPAADFVPNAFLRISPKGSILIYSKGPEIGQGIKTAFPLIIAEELDASWSDVVVEQAPVNPAVYGRQSAGGSRSIPDSWDQLRQAGAVARLMLLGAAAATWKVPAAECTTRDSAVWHGKRSLKYGALVAKAAAQPVPEPATVKLKQRSEYRLLGKSYTGVDNRQVVTGAPLFGIDVKLPGLRTAVVARPPAFGSKLVKFDATAAV
jgi:isoquinoline 1-oxidoreductase beta subunit